MSNLETKTEMIHIRIEPIVKREAEKILERLGINTSYAVSLFLNQVILHDGFPFEVKLNEDKELSLKELKELNLNLGGDKVKENKLVFDLFNSGDIDFEIAKLMIKKSYIQ